LASLIPEIFGNMAFSKKSKCCIDDMSMFAFNTTLLLMSVRTGHTMNDAKFMKKGVERMKFPTPIGLNLLNFSIE
jgi:hypothetical protein